MDSKIIIMSIVAGMLLVTTQYQATISSNYWRLNNNTLTPINTSYNINIGENTTTDYRLRVNGEKGIYFNNSKITSYYGTGSDARHIELINNYNKKAYITFTNSLMPVLNIKFENIASPLTRIQGNLEASTISTTYIYTNIAVVDKEIQAPNAYITNLLTIPCVKTDAVLRPYEQVGSILLNTSTNMLGVFNGETWRWI